MSIDSIERVKHYGSCFTRTQTGPIPARRKQILRARRGASAVECAVLAAVVITCLGVGIYNLGEISNSKFQQAANSLNNAGENLTDDEDGASSNRAEDATVASNDGKIYITGIAMIVACVVPLAYVVFFQSKPKRIQDSKSEEQEETTPPSQEDLVFQKRQDLRRVFQNNMAKLLHGELKVRHVMSRQLSFVKKKDTGKDVLSMMDVKQIQQALVIDKNKNLLGMVNRLDCENAIEKRVEEFMKKPFEVDCESDLSPAVTTLILKRETCLPVTNNGELCGIVTSTDFLMAFQCALQSLGNVANLIDENEIV